MDPIKNALLNFQQKDDSKAALVLVLSYSLGQVGIIMMTSLLIQSNIIGSYHVVPNFFMTRPLLRMYLTISWPSPLQNRMSQQDHSPTSFKVLVLHHRLTTFGKLYSLLCVGIRADIASLATLTKVHQSPSIRLLFSRQL